MTKKIQIPNWMKLSLNPDLRIQYDYLKRWWIIPRNPWFNIYLHRISAADDGRALHDHPWINCSILLYGSYFEQLNSGNDDPMVPLTGKWRRAPCIVFRKATCLHRLVPGELTWSLFITGTKTREWGFQTVDGWVHHREFDAYCKEKELVASSLLDHS